MDDIPEPKIHYSCVLYDDIELHIEICTKNDKISFDDFNNILIFDDEFGQPYTPFYENGSSSYIKNVIDSYNKKMDEFVEKGIFIHKASYEIHTNNKVKIKKKSYKVVNKK